MGIWHTVLDKSIVFSFDRTGFKRHAKTFHTDDIPEHLGHRHIVVTGANSGIGFAAAEVWAARGARVTLVCRNAERGADAQAALRALSPSAHIELIVADLSELSAVATVTSQLEGPIHALVHNAGNMVHELQHSPDGFEIITALHVIVPYALTQALLPQLKAGAQEGCGRIIFVSSGGMYTQPFDGDALETPPSPYDGTRHYAQTKRAQVVLAQALHAQVCSQGISAHAMHPGWVDTPAVRRAMPTFFKMTRSILRTPAQGADTVAWLAVGPENTIDAEWGFWFDRQRVPVHLSKKTKRAEPKESALIPW